MLHKGIVAHLAADTTVASYLQGPTTFRAYPLKMPQRKAKETQIPAIVYSSIGIERQVVYCGTSGLVRETMRLDAYAEDYDTVRELADAVRIALVDFSGSLAGIVPVRHAALDGEFDLVDMEPGLVRRSQTWIFWYEEESA